jgi:prepilin-type N-terminal cleavage/methylation domain-containing protein
MNNKDGFTLIELIISFAILSCIIVPTFNLLYVTTKTNIASEKELSSSIDVQCLFEDIKSRDDFSGLEADGMVHDHPDDGSIKYEIKPIVEYDCNSKHTLYKIHLIKIINGIVLQDFTGTKIIE